MIYLTSDTHFNHSNVIRYSSRPFLDVKEMNETLIENWNSIITPKDEVYHLGDFGFGDEEEIIKIIKKLNGKKYLVKGNHDVRLMKMKSFLGHFVWIKDYYEFQHNKNKIVLCHFPFYSWNKSHYGSFHCHGHSHASLQEVNKNVRRMDVGVDANNYFPVSIDYVEQELDKKGYFNNNPNEPIV